MLICFSIDILLLLIKKKKKINRCTLCKQESDDPLIAFFFNVLRRGYYGYRSSLYLNPMGYFWLSSGHPSKMARFFGGKKV